MAKQKEAQKLIANNKKAFHDYFIDETYEAGIALSGTEVKSIRAGAVNMKDSYCTIEQGEMYVTGDGVILRVEDVDNKRITKVRLKLPIREES